MQLWCDALCMGLPFNVPILFHHLWSTLASLHVVSFTLVKHLHLTNLPVSLPSSASMCPPPPR